MTPAPNNWPDPARPGMPPSGTKADTWHWFKDRYGDVRPARFMGWASGSWFDIGAIRSPSEMQRMDFQYLGPCTPPSATPAVLVPREPTTRTIVVERDGTYSVSQHQHAGMDCQEPNWLVTIYPDDPDMLAAAPPVDVGRDVRALFEAWFRKENIGWNNEQLLVRSGDRYAVIGTQADWEAFQAGAALTPHGGDDA